MSIALARGNRGRWLLLSAAAALAAIWVLSVSRVGGRIEGCPEGCALDERPRDAGLRVLSLNMLHGFPRFEHLDDRLDLIAAEIDRLDPDVVCLQEVPWRPGLGTASEYLADQLGLNYVYVRANGNRWAILFEEGEAILSRYPLRNAAFVELAPRAAFFEHRVALRATAETPWGDAVIIVTHLTHGDPQVNRAQFGELKSFAERSAEGATTIVAGDFNATEDVSHIAGIGWIDTFRAYNPDDPGYTCCIDDLVAGPRDTLDKRIDYVFLVSNGEGGTVVDSHRVLVEPGRSSEAWLRASDHVGILTVIVLGAADSAGPDD